MLCKLQYKTFEPGEFVNEQVVAYEEALKIIEAFPWQTEREKIVIDLTNPSVTFYSNLDFYLKLALYYNGKFVLHYFDRKHLYTKSLIRVTDGYPMLRKFFLDEQLDVQEFRKELTPFKNLTVHFVSQDFVYSVSIAEAKRFYFKSYFYNLFFVGSYLVMVTIHQITAPITRLPYINNFIYASYFLLITGWLFYLFLSNFYKYSKDKTFIASKGNDSFYFGLTGNLSKYSKSEIHTIEVYRTRGENSRSGIFDSYRLYKIIFNDKSSLLLTSMFLNEETMRYKFTNQIFVLKMVFLPWIKRSNFK